MTVIGSFVMQSREILPVDVSYDTVIGGRTVDSITVTPEVPVGMILVSQTITANVLQLYVRGGTTGTSYRWTLLCDIVIGGKTTRVEDEFDIVVTDI